MKQAFYPLHKQNITRVIVYTSFPLVPGCLLCMWKRGIQDKCLRKKVKNP